MDAYLLHGVKRAWWRFSAVNFTAPTGPSRVFERGWDADEEHLNPMAYVALHRIHVFLEQKKEAQRWLEAFEDAGGEASVAPEWIGAIHHALNELGADFSDEFTDSITEEG